MGGDRRKLGLVGSKCAREFNNVVLRRAVYDVANVIAREHILQSAQYGPVAHNNLRLRVFDKVPEIAWLIEWAHGYRHSTNSQSSEKGNGKNGRIIESKED